MSYNPVSPNDPAVPPRLSIVDLLEHGDGLAHVLIAALLLLLAIGVVIESTYTFVLGSLHGSPGSFGANALIYLSGLLFGVIILELLSTILTYIHARNLEATIKDFLIVGLISSVRKILLVGAQSSLASATEKASGNEFVKEASGTVVSIIGILLLIGGLLLLDRRNKSKAAISSVNQPH